MIDMNVLMLRDIDMCSFLLTNQEQHFAFCILKCHVQQSLLIDIPFSWVNKFMILICKYSIQL